MGEVDQDTVEHWQEELCRREFRRLAQSLSDWAKRIEDEEDFPNQAPKVLAAMCGEALDFIVASINDAPAEEVVQLDHPLNLIAEMLGHAEASKVAHTPWSMIESVEDFFGTSDSNKTHFLIRPQWTYNYSTTSGNITNSLRAEFSSLDWFPIEAWSENSKKLGGDEVYYVSFPRAERLNALLHALLGHEFGHILAFKIVEDFVKEVWNAKKDQLRAVLRVHCSEGLEDAAEDLFKGVALEKRILSACKNCMLLIRKAFHELTADFLATHLFGPAAFIALLEQASIRKLDTLPKLDGKFDTMYPPWRYRIRECVNDILTDVTNAHEIALTNDIKLHLAALKTWVERGSELASDKSDIRGIESYPITRSAYKVIEEYLPELRFKVISSLPERFKARYSISENLSEFGELVQLLVQGIPPNEYGAFPDSRPANLPCILNAGWARKCRILQDSPGNEAEMRIAQLNAIILKGIEASFVHTLYARVAAIPESANQ